MKCYHYYSHISLNIPHNVLGLDYFFLKLNLSEFKFITFDVENIYPISTCTARKFRMHHVTAIPLTNDVSKTGAVLQSRAEPHVGSSRININLYNCMYA